MKVGDSIRKAIDDWERGEIDSAMLHACNAVDGTAKKAYPTILGNNARFTRLLRDNYSILGPMALPRINIADTRFPVSVAHPKAPGGKPDLADVVYGIHRCSHGHGDELPDGFELIRDAAGPVGATHLSAKRGKVQLSDRIIFGLLAVAVMSPVSKGQAVPEDYFLTFGEEKLPIKDWWGRGADFAALAAKTVEPPGSTIDFSAWGF